MENENTVPQDETKNEEESFEEETQEESEEEEQEEESKEDVVTLSREEYNELAKAKRLAKKNFKKEEKADKPQDPDLESRLSNIESVEKKRDFGYRHNLSPEEVDFIYKVDPNLNPDTLKQDFVKYALQGYSKRKKVSENTPNKKSTSFRTVNSDGKPLSKEAKNQAYQERIDEIIKSKK